MKCRTVTTHAMAIPNYNTWWQKNKKRKKEEENNTCAMVTLCSKI